MTHGQVRVRVFAWAAVLLAAGGGAAILQRRGDTQAPPAVGAPPAATDGARTPAAASAAAQRPSPFPDRVILTWCGDPASTQAVTWRTEVSARPARAQIAEADAGPGFVKHAATRHAETRFLESDLGPAQYHTARFDGLLPSTRYAYRVGDGEHWSEWFQFRTAAARPAPFSFIYFGDAQNDLKSLWSRVIREAFSDAPRASFIVHAGDLINTATRDEEWGEWHRAGGWVNGMIPSVPTPGNHEYSRPAGSTGPRSLSRHWRPQFALPENGPPGLEETVYSFDYQGLRVISLNSNERQAEQVEWLESRLADNPNPWTVVTFHHPLYASARGRDNAELRRLWEPVFRRHRVDLVLQGHDHTYARSNLNTGAGGRDAMAGTVYVVSVSGPKMYNLNRESWMRRAAEDTQLYQIITIDGDELRYEARTAVGDLYDAFDLRKRPGRINRMTERVPDAPERLRKLQQVSPARAGG
jgi:3',5'-cyclic AMP phosphodiesterase CpdA